MEASILVTGGAGFIGSNFILQWIASGNTSVLNLDKLTYAGNLNNLRAIEAHPRYRFEHGDIFDRDFLRELLGREKPRAIVHFAAESHVNRSIHGPDDFIRTNINGTFNLLEEARAYWSALSETDRAAFRFLHVSTDEVYGSLGPTIPLSARLLPTHPIAHTPHPRPLPIIWFARTTILTDFPRSPPTVLTTTGPISFQKN